MLYLLFTSLALFIFGASAAQRKYLLSSTFSSGDWDAALAACQSDYNTALATIQSAANNDAAMIACKLGGTWAKCWIGLNDRVSEGNYHFVDASGDYDATPVVYSNWGNNQPDNTNNEDCGHMIASSQWTDKKCDLSKTNHGALCNAPPTPAPTTGVPTTGTPTTGTPTTGAPTQLTDRSTTSLPTTGPPTTGVPTASPTTGVPTASPTTTTGVPTTSPTTPTGAPTPCATVTGGDDDAHQEIGDQVDVKDAYGFESSISDDGFPTIVLSGGSGLGLVVVVVISLLVNVLF